MSDRFTGVSWVHVGIEFVAISVGVLLAFYINQLAGEMQTEKLVNRTMEGCLQEIRANRETIENILKYHEESIGAWKAIDLESVQGSAFEYARDHKLPFPKMPQLRSSAWQTAVSQGTLRYMDYETAMELSEIYHNQAIMQKDVDVIEARFIGYEIFDPAQARSSLMLGGTVLGNMIRSEREFVKTYAQFLEKYDHIGE